MIPGTERMQRNSMEKVTDLVCKSVPSFDPNKKYDPAEISQMQADSHNKAKGNLTGYDCKKCLNRGTIAIPKADGGRPSFKECECMNIRRCVQKMEASGLRDVITAYTFEKYNDSESWQTAIKKGAEDYAQDPGGWLLFCGQSGSGKTHLCTAVCRKLLLDGKEVRYMPWRQDVRELKAMVSTAQTEALRKLQTAPYLFIDDLFKTSRAADGSGAPSVSDANYAFDIINYRYTKRLPTIISTECTPEELVDIDEATGGRIVEMAHGHTYSIEKRPGRNYRLRGVCKV